MNRSSRTSCVLAVVVASLTLLSSCSTPLGYNRAYVEYSASKLPVLFKGKVWVVTTPEADAAVTMKAPSSFSGGAVEAQFQSGIFVRDTALMVFSRAFVEGGEHRSSLPIGRDLQEAIIVEPRMVSFDHKNNVTSMIVPQTQKTARAVVSVRFHLNENTVIDREYDSGYVAFEANSGFGGDGIPDPDSYSGRKKRLVAERELNFAHAFSVAFQLALKDMESFMPRESRLSAN